MKRLTLLFFIKTQFACTIINLINGLLFSIIFISVGSCNQKNSHDGSIQKKISVTTKNNKLPINKLDTILNTISDYVEGHRFVMTCTSQYNLVLKNDKGDMLYQDSIYSPKQIFVDFNGDGFKDILIEYMTNIPGVKDLLLYDAANKTFKKVINFQDYPSTQRLGHTKYYYSYHRSGCADLNWDSDLFYIENFKTIKIGSIGGRECEDAGGKDGIYINKIIDGKKIEVQMLAIGIIKKHKDNKWGFIDNYWRKNHNKFL